MGRRVESLEDRRLLSASSVFSDSVPIIVDDSDASGFALSGEWAPFSSAGVGRNGNVHTAFGESNVPADVATWTFNLTSGPGRYRVSATWFTNIAFSHLFTDAARYEVWDTASGAIRQTALVNQKQLPDDFSDAGSTWEDLALVDVVGSSLQVRLFSSDDDQTLVVADAIRIERVAELSTAAEIQVTANGFDVLNNTPSVSIGTTPLNHPLEQTFVISNTGQQTLQITSAITVPSGYTLIASPGLTSLGTGESAEFVVRLDAQLPGTYTGQVSFNNNDNDEGTFNFNINGTVLPHQIIDDTTENTSAFTRTGKWGDAVGPSGRENDFRFALDITGNDTAAWTANVTPGVYRISATWPENATYWATNASFAVLDGPLARGNALIDQRTAMGLLAGDFDDAGSAWRPIGGLYDVASGTVTIRLSAQGADGYVIADAVRLERIGDLPSGAEIEVSQDLTHLTDDTGSLDFGVLEFNHPLEKTFTIANSGAQPLTLSGQFSVTSSAFTITPPAVSTIAPGQSTTFAVRLNATTPGIQGATINFATNDTDESTFNFNVSGTVLATQILDDGQSGYHHTGAFQSASLSIAREGDNSYAFFQSEPSEAFWTFSVTPGQYLAAATWFNTAGTGSLFADNAPFTVFDDSLPLGTFL
ncbi:MAG: choice-of-anchor D domain-containing protein, partial [Planctomycetes bacterium]|nr:choice-of-anchor D domain-containing protein [Planctomycetota bacterium]